MKTAKQKHKKQNSKKESINLPELTSYVQQFRVDYCNRKIWLFGEIDLDLAFTFMSSFLQLDAIEGQITVILNSPGGEVSSGFAIYETIKMAKNVVKIVAIGSCASAAALILQGGDLRTLTPECRFMVHPGSVTLPPDCSVGIAGSFMDEMKVSQKRYVEILAERSTKSMKEVQVLCGKESYMSAATTVEWGFADEIAESID